MALVTYENVVAAAEALVADGQKASVRNVIRQLGGGSPNAVLKLLSEYKAGRPVIRTSDIDLDPSITAAIVRQMRQVAESATTDAEERVAALTDDLSTLAESNGQLEQRVEQLANELTAAHQQIEQLTSQQHDQQLKFAGELDALRAKNAEISNDLDKERERANGAQQALGRAEARAEAVPGLEQRIEQLTSALDAERKARADADQRAAVAEMQSRGASDSNDLLRAELASVRQDARDTREQMQRDIENYRVEVREAAKKLDAARATIDQLREQLAAAVKTNTVDSPAKQEA